MTTKPEGAIGSKLGKKQEGVLLYLAFQTPLFVNYCKPLRNALHSPGMERIQELVHVGYDSLVEQLDTETARVRSGNHSDEKMDALLIRLPEVEWSVPALLNRDATASELSSYSRALKALEGRDLVWCRDITNGRGKRRRTSRVRLTIAGVKVALRIFARYVE
jgi:hypothetical protein